MPLYKEWRSDPYSLAAIWKIEEDESFFVSQLDIDTTINNSKRRLEFLAGRYLLKHVEEDFPLMHIQPDDHDKPRILDNEFYFSISHSFPYVAVVVSPYVECGIDIQTWHPRMEVLQHKFLNAEERLLFKNDVQLLTLAWCTKEAAYKWQGKRGVEFSEHLLIDEIMSCDNYFQLPVTLTLAEQPKNITANAFIDKDFAFAIIVNKEGGNL